MKPHSKLLLTVLLSGALIFTFCKKKEKDKETEPATDFDKPAMLANYADNVIVPNLQAFKTSFDTLIIAYEAFAQAKNLQNLQTLRQKYVSAAVAFQYISTFEFGPSETEIVRSNFNTYPTDTAQINANINAGTYDLGILTNLDAKGFPALDFLFYGKNKPDASVVADFSTGAKAGERTDYVRNCLAEMHNKIKNIINVWKSGYRATFTGSTGSQIGSSLGLLINQMDFEIDLLKNGKVGIPLGKKSLDVPLPEKCEAYYANTISVKLAMACLLNIENVYLGRSVKGADGLGVDDYLVSLKAMHGTETLDAAIKNQFVVAKSKLGGLSEPLSAAITNNTAAVNTAYIELVKLLVLLKTDTPSALGIVITYQDGDGD